MNSIKKISFRKVKFWLRIHNTIYFAPKFYAKKYYIMNSEPNVGRRLGPFLGEKTLYYEFGSTENIA